MALGIKEKNEMKLIIFIVSIFLIVGCASTDDTNKGVVGLEPRSGLNSEIEKVFLSYHVIVEAAIQYKKKHHVWPEDRKELIAVIQDNGGEIRGIEILRVNSNNDKYYEIYTQVILRGDNESYKLPLNITANHKEKGIEISLDLPKKNFEEEKINWENILAGSVLAIVLDKPIYFGGHGAEDKEATRERLDKKRKEHRIKAEQEIEAMKNRQ